MTLIRHITIQILIYLLPAALATLLFQINPYFESAFEEFVWYRIGLSGLVATNSLKVFIASEGLRYSIILAIWFFIWIAALTAAYNGTRKRTIIVSSINLLVALFSLFIGSLLLFGAMQ